MVISAPSLPPPSDASLAAAIGDAGRRASARTLTLVLLAGLLGGLAVLVLWHGHRILSIPFAMPVAFGGWGLAVHAERALMADLSDTAVERALLRVLRVCMIVVGAVAALISIFAVTFAIAGPAPKL